MKELYQVANFELVNGKFQVELPHLRFSNEEEVPTAHIPSHTPRRSSSAVTHHFGKLRAERRAKRHPVERLGWSVPKWEWSPHIRESNSFVPDSHSGPPERASSSWRRTHYDPQKRENKFAHRLLVRDNGECMLGVNKWSRSVFDLEKKHKKDYKKLTDLPELTNANTRYTHGAHIIPISLAAWDKTKERVRIESILYASDWTNVV